MLWNLTRKGRTQGFTLIELVVIIVVIAILTAITAVGYSQYQANGRDASRQTKATAISEALEKYYDLHGEYPSCAQLTQSPDVVSKTVLPGVDTAALKTPLGSQSNSITCSDLANTSNGDYFAYVGDTSEACVSANGNACVLFTLKYIQEGSSAIAQINSRRRTSLVDSQIPTLTTTGSYFDIVAATWTSVPGSVSYTIQYSKTLTFPAETDPNTTNAGTVTMAGSANSGNINPLSYGTLYNLRIKASNATGSGGWSTTKTATTWSLATPAVSASASGFYSINASWAGISNAAGYTLQYSTTTTFPSEAAANSATSGTITTTATSTAINSLTYGTQYYVRLKATASTWASGWSANSTATTWTLSAPSVSCGSTTTASTTCSWGGVANAASYDYQTRINNGAWSASTNTTGTSVVMSNGTQGTILDIRVLAKNLPVTSAWSQAGATLLVNSPAWNRWNQTESYPSWYSWVDRTDGAALCGAGMALYSQFRDGVYPGWNGWSGFTNRGVGAASTATYTSTIANYSNTLNAQIGGYCRNETTGAVSGTAQTSAYTSIHATPPGAVLSGAQACTGSYDIRPQFDVVLWLQETSMDINNNSSVVTWTVYRRALGSSYHTWNTQYQAEDQHNAYVNGTLVFAGPSASKRFYNSYSIYSTEALYQTGTANVDSSDSGSIGIAHNADGTATISGSVYDTFGAQVFGTAGCSLNYTLSDLR